MPEKHICFVSPKAHHYFKPAQSSGAGGAERQQYLIGQELRARGYQISFIVTNHGGSDVEMVEGIKLLKKLPNNKKHTPRYIMNLLSSLHKVDADVYYIRGLKFIPPQIAIYSSIFNKSYIFSVSNDIDVEKDHLRKLNPIVYKLYEYSIKRADQIVAQTEYQGDLLKTNFGVSSKRIPNCYSVPDKEEIIDHDKRDYILWIGRFDKKQKKPHRFLRVAKALRSENFVLIGPKGKNETYYDRIKTESESISNVRFEGFVPPDKVDRYFQKALMLVNTSDFEGFPNTFLEAWRYATPVVSFDYAVAEELQKDDAGIFSGSLKEMINDIERLSNNTELCGELGANGRCYVKSEYSIKDAVNKYEEIIKTI